MKAPIILSTGALALSMACAEPAHADQDRQFPLNINGQQTLVDCGRLGPRGQLTADFLGVIDSGFHGAPGRNMYTMSTTQRQPYLDRAVNANPSFSPSYLRAVFERPYIEYAEQNTEAGRIGFLKTKIAAHGLDDTRIEALVDACTANR